MKTTQPTTDVRCDRHEDAYYPVKCEACESLTREYQALNIPTYPVYRNRDVTEDIK